MENTLTVNQIRSKFLNYMKEKGHAIVPSSSLVPENDPTTLFTGSGMQPMLPYLLGQPHPLGTRIADSQKCFRSQDIEEVGDNRHTTFFEMLGNWSFGDYFKEEQISWMWDFLIDELKLDPNNFYITCFAGNEELGVPRDNVSAELWQNLFKNKGINALISDTPETGMKEGERIFYYSEKKNWWSRSGVPANMPEGEPGGPDSEMFYDFDTDASRQIHEDSRWASKPCHVNCDCGRFLEIGNNVFMQYKKSSGKFDELPQMNVDHGSGLERYAAALRNDSDMFNIDVFDKAKEVIEKLIGYSYSKAQKDVITFNASGIVSLSDTTPPRIVYSYRVILDHIRSAVFLIADGVLPGNKDQMYFVRRLLRRAIRFGTRINIEGNFCALIAKEFIVFYKDVYTNLNEKESFILGEIEKEEIKFKKTLEKGIKILDTLILKKVKEVCSVCGGDDTKHDNDHRPTITGKEAFELLQSYGFPIELTEEVASDNFVMVDREGFEKEKEIHAESSRTAAEGKFKGGLGGDGEMEVKYHTATHMLHQALREVLGTSVEQKGSNITTERLRFDFSFDRKMTDEEKQKVEDIINARIKESLPVRREEMSMSEARMRGAIGLFGDKYEEKEKAGEKVSIYRIGTKSSDKRGDEGLFSIEFCGGPHVENTKVLGVFKIQKEEAVSAGVRRIKATLS